MFVMQVTDARELDNLFLFWRLNHPSIWSRCPNNGVGMGDDIEVIDMAAVVGYDDENAQNSKCRCRHRKEV